MYQIHFTNKMKKDVKLMKKRGKDISKLTDILDALASDCPLPGKIMTTNYQAICLISVNVILSRTGF